MISTIGTLVTPSFVKIWGTHTEWPHCKLHQEFTHLGDSTVCTERLCVCTCIHASGALIAMVDISQITTQKITAMLWLQYTEQAVKVK